VAERLEIEYWPLGQVRAYDRDPRVHSDKQVADLARSIREFGFNVPLLVDRDGMLVAGRGRLAAAALAGLAEVPVIRVNDLADVRARAFRLADNALAERATWDAGMLAEELAELAASGWDDADLITPDDFEPDVAADADPVPTEDPPSGATEDEDDVGEPVEKVVSALGDLWRLRDHRLGCGDATVAADVARCFGVGGGRRSW